MQSRPQDESFLRAFPLRSTPRRIAQMTRQSAARLVATAGVEPDGVGGLHLWILHEGAGESAEGKAEQSPVTFIQALGGNEPPELIYLVLMNVLYGAFLRCVISFHLKVILYYNHTIHSLVLYKFVRTCVWRLSHLLRMRSFTKLIMSCLQTDF